MRAAVAPAPDLVSRRSVRSSVIPASANRDGRCAGLPSIRRLAGARAPMIELPASAGGRGHQSSRPTSASASASSDGQRLGTGASSSSARPSSESPWRGGRSRSSSSAAALSAIAPSRCQAAGAQRVAAHLGLDGGEEPEFGDEALVVGGQLAADARREGVADELSLQQPRGRAPPPLALAGTTGRRSWPPAARPPRRSRGCWPTSRGCGTRRGTAGASGSAARRARRARTGRPTPGQSSSRRRIQARLIRRMPSSMPLVQWTPDRNGFSSPPGAELVGDPVGVPLVMAEEPGGGQQREVLQAGDLPDLLDVAGLLLRAVIDAEGVAVGSGPAAGHRIAEPVGPHHVGPDDAQDLPLAPQQPVRGLEDGLPGLRGHPRGGARRQDGGEPRRSPGGAAAAAASCSRLTCRRDQAARSDLVTGAPGHLGRRHPGRPAGVPAEP